jgi:hypothetical protein
MKNAKASAEYMVEKIIGDLDFTPSPMAVGKAVKYVEAVFKKTKDLFRLVADPVRADRIRSEVAIILENYSKNPVKPRKGETERKFVSRCMSEEKQSFPKLKQRIAVCLSKARKNPYLQSGAYIPEDSDINRNASKMG